MTRQLVYLAFLVFSLVLHGLLLAIAWERRKQQNAVILASFKLGGAWTTFCFLMLAISPTTDFAQVWVRLRVITVNTLPLLYFMLALSFIGVWIRRNRLVLTALWIFPVVTILGVLFGDIPGLFFQSLTFEQSGPLLLDHPVYGVWFYVALIYQSTLTLFGIAIFITQGILLKEPYRRLVLFLAILPIIFAIAAVPSFGGLLPRTIPSLVPFGFAIISPLTTFVMIRYRMMDLKPIAHATVFENMADGVVVIDMMGRVADVNQAALKLFSLNYDALVGTSLDDLTKRDGPFLAPIARLSLGQQAVITNQLVPPRYFDVRKLPLLDRQNHPTGQLITIQEITSVKVAEQEREKVIGLLDGYARMVAHDLKSPVGRAATYAQLLEWELRHVQNVPPHVWQIIDNLQSAGKNAVNIIDELLFMARLRNLQPRSSVLSTSEMLATVRSHFQDQVAEAGATIIQQQTFPPALGYAPWVEQVWSNYLSNALKYGGAPPKIEIGAELRGDYVRFWVKDLGPGLSVAEQAGLFEQFSRLEQHREIEGVGLGLTIAREIIERLGGEVGVEGDRGIGCTFYFTLPSAGQSPLTEVAANVV